MARHVQYPQETRPIREGEGAVPGDHSLRGPLGCRLGYVVPPPTLHDKRSKTESLPQSPWNTVVLRELATLDWHDQRISQIIAEARLISGAERDCLRYIWGDSSGDGRRPQDDSEFRIFVV